MQAATNGGIGNDNVSVHLLSYEITAGKPALYYMVEKTFMITPPEIISAMAIMAAVRFLLIEDHGADRHADDTEAAPQRVGYAHRNGAHRAGEGEVAQAVGADHQRRRRQFAEAVGF